VLGNLAVMLKHNCVYRYCYYNLMHTPGGLYN
jgi:hypothetical protein